MDQNTILLIAIVAFAFYMMQNKLELFTGKYNSIMTTNNLNIGYSILKNSRYMNKTYAEVFGSFDEPLVIKSLFDKLSPQDKFYVALTLIAGLSAQIEAYRPYNNPKKLTVEQFLRFVAPRLSLLQYCTGLKDPKTKSELPVWDLVCEVLRPLY